MELNIKFAIASDLHVALPQTICDRSHRFHLVEVSISALESVFQHLEELELDFLLLPGDLTQDGELKNHEWLQQRLKSLPFPVYVVPGNHDVPSLLPNQKNIGLKDFPYYYHSFGYENLQQLYYTRELLPGVQLIALNSNQFDYEGRQLGYLDEAQLLWLQETLAKIKDKLVLVMLHHNVVEHLPGQSNHKLGQRYMLDNAPILLEILRKYGVKLIFTGHLHVQDIAENCGIWEITTGSLVSYPHPYRVLHLQTDTRGKMTLEIESHRVEAVPGWEDLLQVSREWLGDRSFPFMLKLLASPPLDLPLADAEVIAPQLRYFWADFAFGDAIFDFPDFPPSVRRYFQQFSAIASDGTPNLIDNQATIWL